MQTQSIPPEKTVPGLPRRLLTDRTYLKDRQDRAAGFAKERVLKPQEQRPEVELQSDTIIRKTRVDEVTR